MIKIIRHSIHPPLSTHRGPAYIPSIPGGPEDSSFKDKGPAEKAFLPRLLPCLNTSLICLFELPIMSQKPIKIGSLIFT